MSRSEGARLARHADDAAQARVQRASRGTAYAADAGKGLPVSNQSLVQALGAGVPLDPGVRAEMERRFGERFPDVRIHDDAGAHDSAQRQLAQAFTVGSDIAFNSGYYRPQTPAGKRLLAHELAHVVQQRRGGPVPASRDSGALEHAAEHAASALLSGTGAVHVGGASAVGIARQPLPAEQERKLAPPRSLTGSLAKDEKSLDDAALQTEIDLIEAWLIGNPATPERDHLVSELQQLHAEQLARSRRREAQAPKPVQHAFGSVGFATDMVEQARRQAQELAQAHRIWLATGQIPQTRTPFSWIEIKKGIPMSRARRYDAMMLKQGQPYAQIEDVTVDNRDPEYLTQQEFKDEFWSRVNAERQECEDSHWFRGPTNKCLRRVDEKYGGPAFKSWRDNREWQLYLRIMAVSDKIEGVVNSGPAATLGRVIGYGAGAATGHDPLTWSEYGADLGGIGDVGLALHAAGSERGRLQTYAASGGLEVGRDADIALTGPAVPAPAATPDVTQPAFAPAAPTTVAPSSTFGPPAAPTLTGGAAAVPDDPTLGGLLPAPIPITSGVDLPQSPASKRLAASLAQQSPEKLGSITPLAARKRKPPVAAQRAQDKLAAVTAVEDKMAVGQSHAAGSTIESGTRPRTGGGAAASATATAAAALKPRVTASGGAATGAERSSATTVDTAPASVGAGRAAASRASRAAKKPATPGPLEGPNPPVAFNASGGRGTNPERLVAIRVAGGGAARKGTYVVEGTPEFAKAASDKRFSIMPESQALSLKFRPAGTAFDQTIQPLQIDGVQVESNGAGTGKGSKHNIAARADIQSSQTANEAAFRKTVGASVAEAHGHKVLLQGGELGVLRPGNASTGGVDSITADVGRTKAGGPGKAGPAAQPSEPSEPSEPASKVFLNDFTGPKTTKAAKATHAKWVLELRDALVHERFGFNNPSYDKAVHDAVQRGEVYVREVRIESTPQGTKVTPLAPRKVRVPASVKADVAKAWRNKP